MAFLGHKASLRSFAILIALTLGFAFPLAEVRPSHAIANSVPVTSDLLAQYIGSEYNSSTLTWPDSSGNSNHITVGGNNGSNIGGTPSVVTTHGAAYGSTESITVLQGTTAESLRFPTGVLPSDYTMLYVARYNGSNKQRIFTGCTYNWISGFWGTAAGVAYHGDPNWLGNSASHFDNTTWLLGADQKNSFRGNSVPLSRPAYTEGIADRLCLNTGGEKSEFQIAEIVIYNRALNLAEVQNVEVYLAEKYHIDEYVASQRDDADQYLVQDLTVAPLTEDTDTQRPGYSHKPNTLAVSWSVHNFSASDYKIEYATSPSGPWTTWDHPISTAMYYEVTGLDSLKAYYFRVSMKVDGAYKPAVTSTTAMSVYYINKLPVTLSQTQESLHNGGTGGGPYLDYCPGGSVAVGLKGVLKDDGWASRTQLMCRTVNYANTEFTSSAVGTTVRGGDNGTAMSSLCSTGAMTGVDVYGSLGTYINAYKTRCNSVFAGEPANPTTAPISGPSFGNVVASNCPLGEYVIGIRGRSGSWLDQLGVVCGTVGAYFVPSAPKLTSVIGAGGKVTLTWEAPTSNGGTPITGYEAHMYETNATTASGSCTTSSELTCTIDVGNIYTSYQFNVQAINEVGKSESSNIIQLAAKPDPKEVHYLPNGKSPELEDGEVIAWTENGFISVSSKPASAEQLKVTTANGLTLYFQSTKDNGDEIPLTSDDVLQLVKNNKLHLTLSGFQPNSDVSFWLFSTPTQMGSAKTDAQGNADVNLEVSGSVPTGNHTVEVNGVNKDGTTTSTAMGVQVLSKVPDGNSSTSSGNTTQEDPATTDDPAAPTDTSGTTTDPTTTESQEPVLDDRGLEIIDPAVDAPVETAEVAVVAITLVSAVTAAASAVTAVGAAGAAAGAAVAGAGGAAGGAAGGTTASRSASSSSTGATSRTAPSSSEATDGDESASITTVDVKHGEFVGRAMHWGDALSLWTIPWMTRLDRPSRTHAVWTARWSPLTSNLISDGAYLRAIFGVFNALLPLLGFILGVVGATQTHGMVLPPSAVVLGAVAVLGVFDAIAGFVGIMTFIIGTVLFDGVHNAGDARLLAGIAAIGFVPATLVTSFRHIRRKHAEGFADWWERLTDIAVGSFLAGWVTKSIVGALPALAGVKLPIADYADEIGIAVAVAMPIRIALEEIAAQYFPARLNRLHPDVIAPASNLQKSISLALRAAVFMFVASAFIGWNWQLYVGTIVFIVPAYLNVFQDKLPNYPRLYQFLPAGLPGMAWALWLASYVLTVLISVYGESPDLAKMAFVVLPLVSLVFSTLGALGRAPAPGDVRWYQRPTWSFIYRIGGVAILVYTMHLAGIV